jgi:hypothetical protein
MYVRIAIWIIVVSLLSLGALGIVWATLRNSPTAQAQQGAGDCPGARTINTTTGSDDKQSQTFQTTGDSFRVTTSITPTSQNPDAGADADVTSQDGQIVDTVGHDGEGSESSIVNAPPGTYFLDIGVDDANYTFTVEDCTGDRVGGSTTGGRTTPAGGTTAPNPSPNPPPGPSPGPTPSPPPQPNPPPAPLFKAGGPSEGPVPTMPGGGCPREYPEQRGNACYAASVGS